MDGFNIWLIIILGLLIITFAWHFIQYLRNNSQPKITHEARVISKRQEGEFVRKGLRIYYNLDRHTDKYSYITFQILSTGKKKEYCVKAKKYEEATENELVILTLQGTRYIDFEKTVMEVQE